jgi:hypothetical protein
MSELWAAYWDAREARDRLIDHPDTSVPVEEYKRRLHAAMQAVDDAHATALG